MNEAGRKVGRAGNMSEEGSLSQIVSPLGVHSLEYFHGLTSQTQPLLR